MRRNRGIGWRKGGGVKRASALTTSVSRNGRRLTAKWRLYDGALASDERWLAVCSDDVVGEEPSVCDGGRGGDGVLNIKGGSEGGKVAGGC